MSKSDLSRRRSDELFRQTFIDGRDAALLVSEHHLTGRRGADDDGGSGRAVSNRAEFGPARRWFWPIQSQPTRSFPLQPSD